MANRKRKTTTVLTVDAGPDDRAPARFYRLRITRPDSTGPTRDELLVPDGDELRITHRHEFIEDEAA
jgi:hypothetical protein